MRERLRRKCEDDNIEISEWESWADRIPTVVGVRKICYEIAKI